VEPFHRLVRQMACLQMDFAGVKQLIVLVEEFDSQHPQ
jgi:hypothetical protein